MAWSRDRVDSSNINNGNEYQKGDRVSRQQLNAMVNAGLYSQDFVEALTETPVVNNEEVNANPTVNLIPYEKNGKGFYKFEFNNIKGKTGATGADGQSATISRATAEILNEGSDTPSIDVQLGGTPTDRTFHFIFKDILSGSTGPSALLYDELGDNTDGALTQKKSTEELNKKVEFDDEGFTEDLPTIQTQIDSLNSEIENLRKLLSVSSLPLGTIISSAIMQGSSSLHLLDGGELSIGGTYDAFCQFIIEAYNRDNTSVPVTDLETYQSEIATYGQCGKFVITDTYVKLPIITKFIEGISTISDLGKSFGAGIPNITGKFGADTSQPTQIGAFRYGSNTTGSSTDAQRSRIYTFDASLGETKLDGTLKNDVYGKSDTVQPQSTKYPYYIVVGTITKTDIEVNLDNVATDLNNKADKSGANILKDSFRENLGFGNITYQYYTTSFKTTSETTLDISSIIPDWVEGAVYMLYGYAAAVGKTYMSVKAYSDVMPSEHNLTYTGGTSEIGSPFTFEVSRYFYYRASTSSSYNSSVSFYAYRRVQ